MPSRLVHRVWVWVNVIDAAAVALCPVVVSAGAIFAAMVWPAPAHADSGGDATNSVLSAVGLGSNGPVSTAIAQLGQSICPMLVKPGEQFATSAAQAQGNSGLGPAVAGVATGMAIQMECPAIMASIANGTLPSLLQGNATTSTAATPFQLPGTSTAATPFQLPATSTAATPFQLPATSSAPAAPFAVPGLSPAPAAPPAQPATGPATSSPFQLPHL